MFGFGDKILIKAREAEIYKEKEKIVEIFSKII